MLNSDFLEQTRREHPEYAERLIDALSTPARTSVRLNTSKFERLSPSDQSFLAENIHINREREIPWEKDAYYLKERPSFTQDPLFHAGLYYVQESSSMVIGAAIREIYSTLVKDKPLKVLDLCAAPGGKSTHIASVLGPDDLLVSNEIVRSRANILQENLLKWGVSNSVVTGNDPSHFASLGSWFDIIVVDAPCSGEGLWRRDPAAMKEWSAEAVNLCSVRQTSILNNIWPVLKPGGMLVYSTCTFNKSENDDQVRGLIDQGDAESVRLNFIDKITDENHQIIQSDANDAWIYRLFPGYVQGEGLTFSVLRKTSGATYHYPEPRNKNRLSKVQKTANSDSLANSDAFEFLKSDKETFAVEKKHSRDIVTLDDSLYVHQAGIPLGDEKRVAHGLALSNALKDGFFDELEVSREQAIAYLRRESISIDGERNGIQLLTYLGTRLGFGKATRGRLNNHYPVEWRIRN